MVKQKLKLFIADLNALKLKNRMVDEDSVLLISIGIHGEVY
ncbi:hypothetical protein [Sediminispirochaeta bajacaliforniensis]|nr:hypothetical protein [Sediminispirochaeta bajacaliforniensis]